MTCAPSMLPSGCRTNWGAGSSGRSWAVLTSQSKDGSAPDGSLMGVRVEVGTGWLLGPVGVGASGALPHTDANCTASATRTIARRTNIQAGRCVRRLGTGAGSGGGGGTAVGGAGVSGSGAGSGNDVQPSGRTKPAGSESGWGEAMGSSCRRRSDWGGLPRLEACVKATW